jgi:hypothetical protein
MLEVFDHQKNEIFELHKAENISFKVAATKAIAQAERKNQERLKEIESKNQQEIEALKSKHKMQLDTTKQVI